MSHTTQNAITSTGITLPHDTWQRIALGGFLVAGVLFIIASAISFVIGQNQSLTYLDAHMTVALMFVLVGVGGLYAIQRHAFGRFGRIGSLGFLVGLAVMVVGTAAAAVAMPFETTLLVAFPLTYLGGLLMGITTYRSGVLPRWTGVVLAIALPSALLAGVIQIIGRVSHYFRGLFSIGGCERPVLGMIDHLSSGIVDSGRRSPKVGRSNSSGTVIDEDSTLPLRRQYRAPALARIYHFNKQTYGFIGRVRRD